LKKDRHAFREICTRVGNVSMKQPSTLSWIERSVSHTGNEKYPAVGSSGEYWSMDESLNQGFAEMKD